MKLRNLSGIVIAAWTMAIISSQYVVSKTSPQPNTGIAYHSEAEAKKDLEIIKQDLGLEHVKINIVFKGSRQIGLLFLSSNTWANKLDGQWLIQLAEEYRTRDALEHEAYHVFAYQARKFPFADYPVLQSLSLIKFYEDFRANQYALHGRK